jgi:hypothetical protein
VATLSNHNHSISYAHFDLKYAQPIRKAWKEALTNGQYRQGKNSLTDTDGACCALGVLCSVFVTMYPGRVKVDKDAEGRTTYDGEAFVVPQKIAEIVGLSDRDGKFRPRSEMQFSFGRIRADGFTLSELNDYCCGNFQDAVVVIDHPRSRLFIEV